MKSKLLTVRLDFNGLPDGLVAEASCHAVVEQVKVGILKFENPPAVDAHQMIVGRSLQKIRIIGRVIVSQIDLSEEIRLHQQPEGAINCSPRGFGIQLPSALEKLVGREMLVFGKSSLDDGITLPGPPQPFAADEFIELFLDRDVHEWISNPGPP